MNKIYKLIVATILGCFIFSTFILTAGQEQRNGFVEVINNLFCGNTYSQQESVAEFLAKLHATDDAAFHQLFDFVVFKKGTLNYNLTRILEEKKLMEAGGKLSNNLIQTFQFLKQIIDDYNKENKTTYCKACCGGCFIPWCRENGIKTLKFTFITSVALITAIVSKNKAVRFPGVTPLDIEFVLNRLAENPID